MSHLTGNGPRTNPTVQPLATVTNKSLRSWELRLGPVQIVVLLGVALGCMTVAFFYGFSFGQRAGFESAQASSLTAVPKLPAQIEDSGDDESAPTTMSEAERAARKDMIVSEVYEKLDKTDDLAQGGAHNEPPGLVGLGMDPAKSPSEEGKKLADTAPSHAAEAVGAHPKDALIKDLAPAHEKPQAIDGGVTVSAKQIEERGAGALPPADQHLDGHSDREQGSSEKNPSKPHEVLGMKGGGTATYTIKEPATGREAKREPASTATNAKTSPPSNAAVKVAAEQKHKEENKEEKGAAASAARELPVKSGATNSAPLPKGGWFAQVAAPKQQKDAQDLAKQLRASGFSASIETADIRGEKYYRVLVGPEKGKPEADQLILQLKRESYVKGQPFLRSIK